MRSVLIVDDNESLRKKLKEVLLCISGLIHVLEASNSKECARHLSESRIDVVIMDIHLKKENGIILAEKIKRNYPDIFIVVHSTFDSIEYKRKACKIGLDGFISKKENTLEDLVTLIVKQLDA